VQLHDCPARVLTVAGVAAAHKQNTDCLSYQGQRHVAPTLRDWFHGTQEELSELQPGYQGESPAFLACAAANVAKKALLTKEPSPYDSSPFTNSPRLFWKEQTISPKSRFGSENEFERDDSQLSLSPKRNSIENLKKASRVKNSSMFAREQKNEYDPSSVQLPNRPLAAGRPLSTQVQGNAFGGSGLTGMRQQNNDEYRRGHRRGESLSKIPTLSPSKTSPAKLPTQSDFESPPPGRMSPTKSSLASPGRFNSIEYNPESSMFSEDEGLKHETPRALRRHAKSVTFDQAPPTIEEYEMVTPEPSIANSVASGSRQGSYESDEEELSFDQDDSFDASLEDTDKTPVVLPEDWRHMSPDAANTSLADTYDDVFDPRDNSPMPTARPSSAAKANSSRHGSTASDGDSRPLPPLPGMDAQDGNRRRDSNGLQDAAERASRRRSLPQLPQAPSFSKADLLNMREGSMSLEDRLGLMNFDEERNTSTPTQETHDKKTEVQVEVAEVEESTIVTEIGAETPRINRISRESILRKVKSRNFDEERESSAYSYNNYEAESSPERSYGDLADLDPDVPIPSRECSSNFDDNPITGPHDEADSVIDAYSFAETTEMYTEVSQLEDYERDTSVIRHEIKVETREDDEASQYSPQPEEQPTSQSTIESSGPPTPTAAQPSPSNEEREARRNELFADFDDNEIDLNLDPLKRSFQTAASPLDTAPKIDAMRQFLRRPETPETDEDAEIEEPGTPDSVIRHPIAPSPPASEASSVPEVEATIKGAGGRLKTRPSLIPGDLDMAATRRQVSGEHPPPVPERSPKRQSLSLDISHIEEEDSQMSLSNKENRLLNFNLDIGDDSNDLSFGLDREFDNIIEAQKVDNLFPLPSFAQFPASSAADCGEVVMSTNDFANHTVYKQKGYLMRQNTKVVVASSRQFSDEKPPAKTQDATEEAFEKAPKVAEPRKTSAERKPNVTTEPWNGKMRRRSIRTTSGARRAAAAGPVPPMPGQESAVAAGLDSVTEQEFDEFEEGQERGRLFVKVVGVKDLDLPLPKSKFPQHPCEDIRANI
jgi:hypothetical protein